MGKTTRVVVCGMKGVGKTALLEQLVYGNIDAKTVCILGYVTLKSSMPTLWDFMDCKILSFYNESVIGSPKSYRPIVNLCD